MEQENVTSAVIHQPSLPSAGNDYFFLSVSSTGNTCMSERPAFMAKRNISSPVSRTLHFAGLECLCGAQKSEWYNYKCAYSWDFSGRRGSLAVKSCLRSGVQMSCS